jgi:hypothetical protein
MYKIIHFDEVSGSIVVKYDENMSPINIDVPLNDEGKYVVGEELDSYIRGFIPVWHIERINKIAAGIPNTAEISALVQPELNEQLPVQQTIGAAVAVSDPVPVDPSAIANAEMWERVQFEKQLGDALVKFGLLQQNPVNIPVAGL